MKFTFLTIFPHIFDSYINESILKRAQKNKLIKINIHNFRDFATDKHHTVDDKPYGGGPGMVLRVEPIVAALKKVKRTTKTRVILFEAAGKLFTQIDARRYVKRYNHLVFISGRYEGVDQRVVDELVTDEISVSTLAGETSSDALIFMW